jgi:cell volume regulation protein A
VTSIDLPLVLVAASAVIILAIVGVRFAGKLGLPGLLLYLVIGLVIGWVVPGIDFEDAGLAVVLASTALVFILAHGGLTTRTSNLRPVLAPALMLATIGVTVSILVVAMPLIWFGVDPVIAILFAAVLAPTDAAAVFSVLRRVPVSTKLRSTLEGEAGFNDAPVVVLVTLVAGGALDADPIWIPILVLIQLIGGAVVGIGVGFGARWLLPRMALPAVGLYPIAAVTFFVMAFGLAAFAQTSGFMAVYVAAVIVGSSSSLPHRRGVVGFSDGLSWLAEIGLFVMLGLLASPARLPQAIGLAAAGALLLVVAARPLSAVISLAPFRWRVREIGFVSFAGLRGAVPIVFAAIPLGLGIPGSQMVFDATLIVVLVLTLVQSPLLPWMARVCRVADRTIPGELDVDVAPLDQVDAVVLSVDVEPHSNLVGIYVRELGLPVGATVALVLRADASVPVTDETRLREGDRVVLVCPQKLRERTEKRMQALARDGRLAGWSDEATGEAG